MKKYSILFMAIATILFISCSKDDNDYDYDDGTWSTVEITVDVTKVPMKITAASQGEKMHTDWGDGSIESDLPNAWIHTYTTPGNYKITMKVRNMDYANVYYYYSSIHFKDCPDLERIRSMMLSGNSNDTLTMPKTVKIENCPNLVDVGLPNQRVKNLEIENCPSIKYLTCYNHKLSSLNLDLPLLEELDCSYGRTLKELDLSHLPALKTLNCSGNELSDIDLKKCSNLVELSCSYNQLTELNLGNCCELTELDCSSNQLTELNFKGCNKLENIGCTHNILITLNLEDCHELKSLNCEYNKLVELDVSNNTKLKSLNCNANEDLETIWVWENAPIKHGIYGRPYISGWNTSGYVKFIEKK